MKFGGTSVANAEAIKRTIEIVRSRLDKKPIVVVSALAKVTDALYNISYAAENCNLAEASDIIEKLRIRHFKLAYELLGSLHTAVLKSERISGHRLGHTLRIFAEQVTVRDSKTS